MLGFIQFVLLRADLDRKRVLARDGGGEDRIALKCWEV